MEQISSFSNFKNLFYTEYTFVFAYFLLVQDADIMCVDWVCHTEILWVIDGHHVPSQSEPEPELSLSLTISSFKKGLLREDG